MEAASTSPTFLNRRKLRRREVEVKGRAPTAAAAGKMAAADIELNGGKGAAP